MNRFPTIVYAAPGAGLGHLMRAAAVCLALKRVGVRSRIVTHSIFAQQIAGLTGIDVDVIPSPNWIMDAVACIASSKPDLVVLDTFPWGLRGEWRGLETERLRCVTLARRLNVDAYVEAVGACRDADAPQLKRIIACEPLNDDYLDLLQCRLTELHTLSSRIRFPAEELPVPLPPALDRFQDGLVRLVVHSGPTAEVESLISAARQDIGHENNGAVVAVLPRPNPQIPVPQLTHIPAAALFSRSHRVVTGGGYNSVAESAPAPERHLHVAFPRRYDDQAARLREGPRADGDGAGEAAHILTGWL